ncbi:hypothetical protein PSEWESI4_04924 [Pseudomonas carbonaria]|uniref:Type VI secretion system secreted protein VgrG n=1 Tax=Zestomonas carbonaria TaxID=2762745 RepID=A0A7U7IBY4_9GAMM|nr:hypothetical protein PSEWESI4_04924 [Pseudomonas carbonaria]
MQGHHQLEAGQSIERKTTVYRLEVGESAVLEGPGGTITLNDAGIAIDGVALRFKGKLDLTGSGSGNPLSSGGEPNEGKPGEQSWSWRFTH